MYFLSIIDLNLLKDRILRHDLLTMAAAIAFYTALALSPLMILLLTFLGSLSLSLQHELLLLVQDLMGREAASLLSSVIENLRSRPSLVARADAWSFAVVLFSGSVVFTQIQSSLNTIYETPLDTDANTKWWQHLGEFLIRRAVSVGVMLVFIIISAVSIAGSAFLSFAASPETKDWVGLLHHMGTFLVYSFVFALIFKWMPDRKVSWPATLQAGLMTAFLFVFGKIIIGIYLKQAALGSAYGAAGSLMVFLVWIYYSALTFLLGAEVSALLSPAEKVKHYRRIGGNTSQIQV